MSSQPVRRRRRRQRCKLSAAQLLLSLGKSLEAANESKLHRPKRQPNQRKLVPHNPDITDTGVCAHHPHRLESDGLNEGRWIRSPLRCSERNPDGTGQTETVTRRNVAGIEVWSSL